MSTRNQQSGHIIHKECGETDSERLTLELALEATEGEECEGKREKKCEREQEVSGDSNSFLGEYRDEGHGDADE
jgi:hypothetical protein